jgi:glycosyltransferase involved in cell wall biosynthesis
LSDLVSNGRSRLRLAYFTPLPPARSGIADYSRELLPYLAQLSDLTLFTDNPEAVDAALQNEYCIRSLSSYGTSRWQHDVAVYQMGNSSHHRGMYPVLLRYPGITVLHDYGLHHFLAHSTVGEGNYAAYVREMGYSLGQKGVDWAWDILYGRREHPLFEEPLNERVLDHSLGVIVHSRHVAEQLRAKRPFLPLALIPAPIEPRPGHARRAELNWPDDALIFASLGLVTASKQLEMVLRCFAALRESAPHSYFLIAGDVHPEVNLEEIIHRLDLQEWVKCTGFVTELDEFVDWIYTADVVVNLRYPSVGETSATALRALAAGRPLIVFDHGWYSELPDELCWKAPPGDETALLAAMRRLAEDTELRQAMGRAAVVYVRDEHTPAKAALQQVAFIEQVLARLTPSGKESAPID